jgi:colanic acid biosynthesis glycosyl transferase WcaI
MKILISACHFTPDIIGVGKFSGEMAEWLASRGHEVRAVVGAPFYPHWNILEGYSGVRYLREKVRGVDVVRCPIYVPRTQSGLKRLLQYTVLVITALPVLLLWAVRWKPDIVWTVMPPLAGMPTALLAAKLAGAPAWLHVQDFEIDAAFELGLLRKPMLRRVFLGIERRLMSSFRVVSSITPKMLEALKTKRVFTQSLLFPNWFDPNVIYPMPNADFLRDALDIPRTAFVALYSGNLGEKQGVDSLVDVARHLSDNPDFILVVCGDGAGRARLASASADLRNIRLLPLQPTTLFNALLNMADAHLLPQRSEVADLMMPSKLPGMLASGRPVIAGAMPNTQLAQEVEGCGVVVPPSDSVAMADAIRKLMFNPQERRELGARAAERAIEHWGKDRILLGFELHLKHLLAGNTVLDLSLGET